MPIDSLEQGAESWGLSPLGRTATARRVRPLYGWCRQSGRGSGRVATLWGDWETGAESVEPDDWTLPLAVFLKEILPRWVSRPSSSWTFLRSRSTIHAVSLMLVGSFFPDGFDEIADARRQRPPWGRHNW